MNSIRFPHLLDTLKLKTATGFCIAHTQTVGAGCDFVSAITAAKPKKVSALVAVELSNDGQTRVAMSCDINEPHGKPLLKVACEVAAGVTAPVAAHYSRGWIK